jgi:hypothetical protein
MKKLRAVVAALLVLSIVGCTTLVNIKTDPDGAKVYVNEEPVGQSPVAKEYSNFVGNQYYIRIVKEGYKPLAVEMRREVKAGNLIVGLFLFWPLLLWCYGPDAYYTYELQEE